MLKYILLGFLSYKSQTGYELKQNLDSSTGYFWHAYHSQIYTTLRKLEEEGLIVSNEPSGDDPLNRRPYTITDAGRRELNAWLEQPMIERAQIKEDFLVRIFLSGYRETADILAELRLQRKLHEQQLHVYRKLDQNFTQHTDPAGWEPGYDEQTHLLHHSTVKFGVGFEEHYVRWLDELITTLSAKA